MPVARALSLRVQGRNLVTLTNIAVGDVYICSGQSNMEMGIGNVNNAAQEIAAANYPDIRLFTVPKAVVGKPQKSFAAPTRWLVCTPQNVAAGGWGGFSAVAYFFGRELNRRLGIPIGLIHSSWGGTIAQAWTSRDTLLKREDLRDATLRTEESLNQPAEGTLEERLQAWWSANDAGTREQWSTPAFADAAWKEMTVPGAWEGKGLPEFDGVVWFRKTIEIPADWAGKDAVLRLGSIDDRDTTYFNGVQVGAMDVWNQPRVYKIPAELMKAGRATIAVRVLDTGGAGGFNGDEVPRLERNAPDGGTNNAAGTIELAGDWKYKTGAAWNTLPAVPGNYGSNPNQPTVLYNGMIAPLVPFAVRGVIWYQGESNAGNPKQYQTLFPDLIRDWRTVWNAKQDGSEFGFYFVQLANYMARTDQPAESGWAELREAQTMALKVPRTGMATILDIGDAGDIHPRNKQDVGKRLALAALATEYKQKLEYSGPMFQRLDMEAGSNKVRVHFTHSEGLSIYLPRLREVNGKIPLDNWIYSAIAKLTEAGIIEGYPPYTDIGKFSLTRKELATTFVEKVLKNLPPDVLIRLSVEKIYPGSSVPVQLELQENLERLIHELRPELEAMKIVLPDEVQKVKSFAIQSEDGKWHHANARIEGDSVIVWSDEVLKPVAVRYAWANNPDVNLVNAAGLPAVLFRTDKP
jgi:sialate O-acetylesterase